MIACRTPSPLSCHHRKAIDAICTRRHLRSILVIIDHDDVNIIPTIVTPFDRTPWTERSKPKENARHRILQAAQVIIKTSPGRPISERDRPRRAVTGHTKEKTDKGHPLKHLEHWQEGSQEHTSQAPAANPFQDCAADLSQEYCVVLGRPA